MKIYRVEYYEAQNGSQGFEFFNTRREAQAAAKEFLSRYSRAEIADGARARVETLNIHATRAGVLEALRLYASHPDNG